MTSYDLPGVWILSFVQSTYAASDSSGLIIGAFPTYDLAKARAQKYLDLPEGERLVTLWNAQALTGNVGADIDDETYFVVEWVPFFHTADLAEEDVVIDRAQERTILDGRELKLLRDYRWEREKDEAHRLEIQQRLRRDYRLLVRGAFTSELEMVYLPRLRPKPGETETRWVTNMMELVFKEGLDLPGMPSRKLGTGPSPLYLTRPKKKDVDAR